jgi:hypothetical protein
MSSGGNKSEVCLSECNDPVLAAGKQPAALNHTVRGVRVRSKIVPAVTELR